ncbi:hypothetical protein [Streptomyces sp. NPDC059979]|uniref:hypothetical protein n=1 Tax=Streptomyces sp. NPDC059979 TaxID=3347021 RepID=UPI0036BBF1FB
MTAWCREATPPRAATGWAGTFLPDAEAWIPPAPVLPRLTEAERRIALETGTGLDGLRLLSPPPERPYLGNGSWEGLFAELGTRLPGEYVRLMDEYGAGISIDGDYLG